MTSRQQRRLISLALFAVVTGFFLYRQYQQSQRPAFGPQIHNNIACGVHCGTERWLVKTLSDADVASVNFSPQPTTVTSLTSQPAPSPLPVESRLAPLPSRGVNANRTDLLWPLRSNAFIMYRGTVMRSHQTEDRREMPKYGIKEASRYLGMPVATLNSWVNGRNYPTSKGTKFFEPLIILPLSGTLSFYNLVEAHILLSTRKKHRLEMPVIRRAIDYVKRSFPSRHPLLTEQFLTDGKDLFVKKLEGKIREQTINVSRWGQLGLGPILDIYLRRIERDQSGWPVKLFPIRMSWQGQTSEEPPKVVVIDPTISSGRPVVNGTGVMAEIIVGRFNLGEGIQSIADDYGLGMSQVEEVLRYAPAA